MKRILSVSLGSSARDAESEVRAMGEVFYLRRAGTDGDARAALEMLRRNARAVDAFGLGGTDLYLFAGGRRYALRGARAFVKAAGDTPIVDGSGLKDTLERRLIEALEARGAVDFAQASVLLVCGMDRFGMAEALCRTGCRLVCGDLMFGLGLPFPVTRLERLSLLARVLAPVVCRLPIAWLYPVGKAQVARRPRFGWAFAAADVIAGDFHFIRRYMPDALPGKTVITNTVTEADRALLQKSGARLLVTSTPRLAGRSFGTNVIEAMLVAAGARGAADYAALLEEMRLAPDINYLQ